MQCFKTRFIFKAAWMAIASMAVSSVSQASTCQIYLYSCNQAMPLFQFFQDGDASANADGNRCLQRAQEYHDWCGSSRAHAVFYDDNWNLTQAPYRTQCRIYNPSRGWETHPGSSTADCYSQAQSFADSSGAVATGIFSQMSDMSFTWQDTWGAYALPNYSARSAFVPGDFSLVFNDEFNENQLDTSKWFTRLIYGGSDDHMDGTTAFINGEQGRYGESNNHVMTGSTLKLTAYGAASDWEHPTGMIRSKKTFKYGYFEARVKFPKAKGVFPAMWMIPDSTPTGGNGGWPPEIDFFEYVNQNGLDQSIDYVHSGYHSGYNTYSPYLYLDPQFHTDGAPYIDMGTPMDQDFHVLGALWDSDDTITTYIDGRPLMKRVFYYKGDGGQDPPLAHLILNLAVGGWPGNPQTDWNLDPQSFELDYVRVYQRAGMPNGTAFVGQPFCDWSGGCGGSPLTRPGLDFGGMYGYSYYNGQVVNNVNILTGGMSCPAGYSAQQVYGTSGVDFPLIYCYRTMSSGEVPRYDFGGMFGYGDNGAPLNNAMTNATSCPPGFATVVALNAPGVDFPLQYCVRSHVDDEIGNMKFYGMMGYVGGQLQGNVMTGRPNCPYGLTPMTTLGARSLDYPLYYCGSVDK